MMKLSIEVKNGDRQLETRNVRRAYLANFVDPNKLYTVPYSFDSSGNIINEPTEIVGVDLTENQISILFSKELL